MRKLALLALGAIVWAGDPAADDTRGAPYPRSIGDSVGPKRQAFFPVRVRALGKIAWTFSEGAHTGFACPGGDGVLRIQGGGGFIRGVDAATGKRLWIAGGNPRYFNYSSCILGPDGTAYGGNFHQVSAVDKRGELRWRADLGAQWIHRPPALSPDGRTLYVGGDRVGLAALDTSNGKVRWLRRDFNSPDTSYAFDKHGHLVARFSNRIVSYDAKGKELWRLDGKFGPIMIADDLLIAPRGGGLAAYHLATREAAWTADVGSSIRGVAYSDYARIMATTNDGRLIALTTDGKLRWSTKVSARPLHKPTTAAGGDTLVMDADGKLSLVDGTGRVEQSIATGGAPFRWRPTIGPDGSVYVNHKSSVLKITGGERPAPQPLVASDMVAVADDFVVDVWVNGKKLALGRREMLLEVHGATTERIRADLHPGDWIVFHVVANRLRWGGASYFGVYGTDAWGGRAFASTTKGNWSYCDDLARATRFIAERGVGADNLAVRPQKPWGDAERIWRDTIGREFPGEPIWGKAPSTWIKFIVPNPR
ncbi:MAG: outer membrane protein assembly factor BamB family protein [Planctomycetota bacterium]|jgi:hypothetical protein